MTEAGARPLDPAVREQAADWLVRLGEQRGDAAQQQALQAWIASHPDHARAWRYAERLSDVIGRLPTDVATQALCRSRPAAGRRAVLAGLLLAGPAAWVAWRHVRQDGWLAAHRTATGEVRALQLQDGSALVLNTRSAVDVRFDAQQRLVELMTGEILVQTAVDRREQPRPFRVATRDGRMQALGTRFRVLRDDAATTLDVFEGAVRVEPVQSPSVVVQAGQQLVFGGSAPPAWGASSEGAAAWTRGMLLAYGMSLPEFAREIARYRPGLLRCADGLAHIEVSGAYPLADTDQALRMIAATYPVTLISRLGGYWTELVPRS